MVELFIINCGVKNFIFRILVKVIYFIGFIVKVCNKVGLDLSVIIMSVVNVIFNVI